MARLRTINKIPPPLDNSVGGRRGRCYGIGICRWPRTRLQLITASDPARIVGIRNEIDVAKRFLGHALGSCRIAPQIIPQRNRPAAGNLARCPVDAAPSESEPFRRVGCHPQTGGRSQAGHRRLATGQGSAAPPCRCIADRDRPHEGRPRNWATHLWSSNRCRPCFLPSKVVVRVSKWKCAALFLHITVSAPIIAASITLPYAENMTIGHFIQESHGQYRWPPVPPGAGGR